jgi:hypothetical protein
MTDMAEIETEKALVVEAAGDETVAGAGNDTLEAATPEDSFAVEIEGDAPSPDQEDNAAPDWVRKLREENRELKRFKKEAEQQRVAEKTVADIGPKPTLEAMDFDQDRYDVELLAWHEKKRAQDAQAAKAREAQDALEREYQAKQQSYAKDKEGLKTKAKDFDEAEDVVKSALSELQQAVLLQAADNPSVMVLALGRNLERLNDLAKIADPVKLAAAIAKLEVKLSVTTRKPPPAEGRVNGASTGGGNIETQLEKAREEAARTGDYSQVRALKAQMRKG